MSCSSVEPALDPCASDVADQQHSEGTGSLLRKPLLSPFAEQSLSPAELNSLEINSPSLGTSRKFFYPCHMPPWSLLSSQC